MRIGLLSACFPSLCLRDVAEIALSLKYQSLELAAWPPDSNRQFASSHLPTGVLSFNQIDAVRLAIGDLEISGLAYGENNLHPDPTIRERVNAHVRSCIDVAGILEVPVVTTFIGCDWTQPIKANLALGREIFGPLVEYAKNHNVNLVIENCPMVGWYQSGLPGNLGYSPELWEWMDSIGLGLNFDPSHLIWMGIDPILAIEEFAPMIAHVQAKDTEVIKTGLQRYGVLGSVCRDDSPESGWWQYRVPGRGECAWPALINALKRSGYEGVISVEHEDPVFSGSIEQIIAGLKIAHNTITPLIGSLTTKLPS